MRKFLLGTAAVAAAAITLGAGAPKAHAGIVFEYSLNGGATSTTLLSGPSGSTQAGSATLGSFDVLVASVTSNSPGTPNIAKLLGASLDITNTANSTQTIEFAFSDTGFTAPITPPTISLNSHIGGSIITGMPANALSFTSCVSTTNANLTSCSGATAVAGPGTPNVTGAAGGSFKNDQFATITSLSAPYSLDSILTLTLGAGGDLNFATNAKLAPVPEPVTLSVLGTGLVALGLVRRRRRA